MKITNVFKKPIILLLIIVIILNIIDLISAYRILPGESNPIYLLSNSYLILVGVKILVIGLLLFAYKSCYHHHKPNPSALFMFTAYILLFICALLFGIYTNMSASDIQIKTIEQAKSEMTDIEIAKANTESTIMYFRIMFTLLVYPAIISTLAFFIWKKTFINSGGILP